MDTVIDIAQVFGVVAALAAVWYAEQAVMATRALRRDERIARVPDLIADLAEAGIRSARGQPVCCSTSRTPGRTVKLRSSTAVLSP
jgi:hypothetical protein